ncbi:MAG: hypothetical protein ACD_60C00105G0008 [uncultured bacterium]|nr:MAG: hypothetical protein ACD_60C00105G0008 [uncultured bacterium]
MTVPSHYPVEMILHKVSRTIEVIFDNQERFLLPCEYLRVFSPSADVRGHGIGNERIVTGKEHVNILAIEPVGHYAVKFIFSDGHNTGIYSWPMLYSLSIHYQKNWRDYQEKAAWTKNI